MRLERFNVLTLTLTVFLLLGVAAAVMTLYVSQSYREAALRAQDESVSRALGAVARRQLRQLRDDSADFGYNLEHRGNLRAAWDEWEESGNERGIQRILNNPFLSGFASADRMKLEKLRIHDLTGRLVVESSRGNGRMPEGMYPDLSMVLLSLDGVERLQTVGALWRHEDQSFYSTFVPVGGLRVRGYLEIVTDPQPNLHRIGEILEMQVEAFPVGAGEPVLKPTGAHERVVELSLTALDLVPAFRVFAYVGEAELDEELGTNSLFLTIVQISAESLALGLGYLILVRFLVRPIKRMASQMRLTESAEPNQRVRVTIRGLSEFNELADSFNRLMGKMHVQTETLRQMSLIDGLTGLANRRAFDLALEREWIRAHRQRELLSLLLIDIDHFKQYNDAYGHQRGDACLRAVAQRIGHVAARASDLAARYGGEEFVVILPATDSSGAMRIARHILQQVWELNIPHEGSRSVNRVTISIGVASVCPMSPRAWTFVTETADRALYHAKATGRNRVVLADDLALPGDRKGHAGDSLAAHAEGSQCPDRLTTGGDEIASTAQSDTGGEA